MNAPRELPDAAARRAIRGALDRTFLVEAAAGTGKTTELVARLVAVVLRGHGRLASIAAVTFTEKAAGEMKLRIRTELDRALLDPASAPEARARAQQALAELETAKVGTIHGFCADLLRDHPVEAQVDPAFEVADAERQRTLSERVFERWFEAVLEDPPEGVRRVLQRRLVDSEGSSPRQQLMAACARLIETRDFSTPYRRDPFDRVGQLDALRAELFGLAALADQGRPRDPLAVTLARLARKLEGASELDHDGFEALLRRLARDRDVWGGRTGKGELYADELPRSDVLARREALKAKLDVCVQLCAADLAACLSRELAAVVRAYEREKTAAGLLDFFDLLLLAHRLLRDCDPIRHELQRTLSHLFVDEFQDTDPVQSEIILLLSADDPQQRAAWQCRPLPGKLFVVGDPKQSIYRFRRADIALYERVKNHLLASGAELLLLSASFRALPEIQGCVNAAFASAMSGDATLGHAAYVPLSAVRGARADQPALVALPVPRPFGKSGRVTKTAINASLPGAVAAWLDWLLRHSGYRVLEHGADVPVEARHVCLLFRRFRQYAGDTTRDYVRELEARRLPHVMSGGRSFHTREEVIALRSVLNAIEWPDDRLHVYATLRGPFVALQDEMLFSFKQRIGHLHPLGPIDESTLSASDREVAEVLRLLAKLHAQRNRRPIAQTLATFLEELRAHAGVAIWPTGEQALGNVLRVLDFARAYERRRDASSFRGFVEWLDRQAESGETPEASVVEESSDGVRIMTVHAAKGLEFPVVVLCDPTAPKSPEFVSRFIDPERALWAQSLCDCEPIELVEQRERVREHDAAEIVRLAYVAATRAKDLLVVPSCADSVIDGWLDALAPAIYPPVERRRTPLHSSLRLPAFGEDALVDRADHVPYDSVAPGEHTPSAGEQRVVWWDPNQLDLARASAGGVGQNDLLRAEDAAGRDLAGLTAYRAWNERQSQAREVAQVASLRSRAMTQAAAATQPELDAPPLEASPAAAREMQQLELPLGLAPLGATAAAPARAAGAIPLEVLDGGAERRGRPSGPRFGTLVHAILANLDFRADPAQHELEIAQLSHWLGRQLAAAEAEVAAARAAVRVVLGHSFFERVRRAAISGELQREAPVIYRTPQCELLEGVVDLMFREHGTAGTRLILVDFKTDVELTRRDHYAKQLELYAAALRVALDLPVESLLFRV